MDKHTVDASTAREAGPAEPADIPQLPSLVAALPGLFLILRADAPRYTIVGASDAYLRATRSTRDGPRGIVGQGIFEAFPDPPGEPDATGERNVRASIERAVATRAPDPMPVQLYPVPLPDGTWEQHYWSPIHTPVLDPDSGRVTHVIQRVEDVTEQVRLQASLDQLFGEHADSERARGVALNAVAELTRERAALTRANEMLQDQTVELETQTEDLERARDEAEAANRAKSEFLAVMSHELRTPLNAIGGYAELMEMGIRGPVTHAQLEDLRRIQLSQRHLLGLINEVLNYAKLETGTVDFDVADVPVQEAFSATELLVMPQARSKGLTFEVHAAPPTLAVRADPEKLRQILVNLASNAVKFTDAGGRIEISCARAGDRAEIQIRDTGMGIPPDKLDTIFDPFVQVRSDLSRPHEGTGLGLAISRDLALRMAGDLTVESILGVGSTFTLTLPMVA